MIIIPGSARLSWETSYAVSLLTEMTSLAAPLSPQSQENGNGRDAVNFLSGIHESLNPLSTDKPLGRMDLCPVFTQAGQPTRPCSVH